MSLVPNSKSTVQELSKYLTEQGYYVSPKFNKTNLIAKLEAHLLYENTPYKFDKLEKVILAHFAWVVPPHLAIIFGNTCRRLRSIMNINYIWMNICKELPRFKTIHPVDLERKQPEGYWKHWYEENSPTKILSRPSYHARRVLRGESVVETIYPNEGSILTKTDITGLGTISYVCVKVVLLSKSVNKGLPKEIGIAQIHKSFKNEAKLYHMYFRHDVRTLKITASGEFDSKYQIMSPERYKSTI